MSRIITKISILGILIASVLLSGCLLISGTFVLVETFTFTAQSGFYYRSVDVTDNDVWQDHEDEIDFVEAIGMEFFITSNENVPVTFNVYLDDYGSGGTSIPGTATQIIDNLTIDPGETHITYAQSLGFLTGFERLKELARLGQFDYYATSTGNDGNTFIVDSARVIVTLAASIK